MIVFDLCCANDHIFEAWFPDSKAFERQRRKRAVVCPMCGDTKVQKALMAPNVASSKDKGTAPADRKAVMRAAMQALSQLRKQVEENCDYVGPKFPEEARKIHYGESERRDIYGEASAEEAQELVEEGIEFRQIPWVPRADN